MLNSLLSWEETAGDTNKNSVLKLKRNKNKIGWNECSGLLMLQDTCCHDMYLINSLSLSLMSFRKFPEVQAFWLPIPLMTSRQILFIINNVTCRHPSEGVQRYILPKKKKKESLPICQKFPNSVNLSLFFFFCIL